VGTVFNERQLSDVELALATVAKWPMAFLDPEPKYTIDRYQRGAYTDPHKNP